MTAEAGPARPGAEVPLLAAGAELLGEYRGSGLGEATYLARNASGRVVHLSGLLWLVLSEIDGRRPVGEIAARVSDQSGRPVSAGNVWYLLAHKLAPQGLVAGERTGPGAARPDPMILTLKLRRTLLPEAGVQVVAALLRPLFSPPVVVVALGSLAVADVWLVRSGGMLAAFREVLARPLLLLVVLGLSLVSMVFHECGHAAACRYGGARPGRIGMGLYVLWPALFTNVTDSYRLGRAGRLRTDLGGVYFNAVFAVVLAGAYRVTGYLPLLAAAGLTQVELAEQLVPLLRLDGYFIVTDLIGVPDLFQRMGPVLRGLIPGQPADPRLSALKRTARVALTGWVLAVVLLLGGELILVAVGVPVLAAGFARSLAAHAEAVLAQFGRDQITAGLVSAISVVLLIFPVAGIGYLLALTGRAVVRLAAAAARGHLARRPSAAADATARLPSSPSPSLGISVRGRKHIIMLSEIRGEASWSRRAAVTALAMMVPLAIPGVASADGGPSATANSIQYIGVTANPSWDTEAAEYDNSVFAATEHDWRTPFRFDFKVAESDASLITADNYAQADVSRCRHCAATAIAFQVVVVSEHALAKLAATDTALATTEHCTTCHGLAEAFQVVYATDGWSAQQWLVPVAAYQVAFQLRALQYSDLSADQIQARSTSLVNDFISWLQNNCEESTGLLPVLAGPDQMVKLTGDRPSIGLLSSIQH